MHGERDPDAVALTGARLFDAARGERDGSLVVRRGRIDAVLDAAEPPPSDMPSLDLGGRILIPAFCDAHLHTIFTGLLRCRPDLSVARSRDEGMQIIEAATHDPGRPETLIAEGWDESGWPDGKWLAGRDLDAIVAQRPLVARRVCTHVAAANRFALKYFERSPHVDSEAGLLYEDAAMGAEDVLPGLGRERDRALSLAIREAAREGIAEIHEMGRPDDLKRLAELRAKEGLPIRVFFFLRHEYKDALDLDRLPVDVLTDPMLRFVGFKFFMDGSIGARTAAVGEPYLDGGSGRLLWDRTTLAPVIRAIHEHGFRAAIHAIGDRATRSALDALEEAGVQGDRIEHVEMISGADAERMARLGVTASMQPNFIVRWSSEGGLCDRAVGSKRARRMSAFGTLRRAGVPLAFGSDGMPMGPLYGLPGATTHPCEAERLEIADAIEAYTLGGPRSVGRDGPRLEMGSRADLCLLSIRSTEASAIKGARVLNMWKDGRLLVQGGETVEG